MLVSEEKNWWLDAVFFPLDPQISISGDIPIVGKNYILFCNASGSSVTRYEWRKDDVVLLEEGPLLYFSPLRLSDAGHYSCNTTHSNTQNLEFTLSGIRSSTLTQCWYYAWCMNGYTSYHSPSSKFYSFDEQHSHSYPAYWIWCTSDLPGS